MTEIGIGIVGGGYMGKAHAVAYSAVGANFETSLRPRLEMVAATSPASAERYRQAYGFARATDDWRMLVSDPKVDAVIVASPSATHRDIVEAAFAHGKHVFCEKPLGASLADGAAMVAAAEAARPCANMVGFNYIRTPAAQFIRQLLADNEIGDITYFKAEMHEDFQAQPDKPWDWRCEGPSNGALGDLAPHVLNMTLTLMGPVTKLCGELETLFPERPFEGGMKAVTNDDRGQFICEFETGARGHVSFNRAALGRKMGYAFEIYGTKGTIRFDQEDQNSIWLYRHEGNDREMGFKQILTNPSHPDYVAFNLGPGHGTGYQDQIIIEARDFLTAIETGAEVWPSFREGQEANRLAQAVRMSDADNRWVALNEVR